MPQRDDKAVNTTNRKKTWQN